MTTCPVCDTLASDKLANTPYSYLLTDTFTKNSVILNKMFDLGPESLV